MRGQKEEERSEGVRNGAWERKVRADRRANKRKEGRGPRCHADHYRALNLQERVLDIAVGEERILRSGKKKNPM